MATSTMQPNGYEEHRVKLQDALDRSKLQHERNRLGQYATPISLAQAMLREAEALMEKHQHLRFLDPAIGTGVFYSALLDVFGQSRIEKAVGYEIDPHYGLPAKRLWTGTGIDLRLEDFTQAAPPPERGQYNLLVCNPPYVRHHHLSADEKHRLRTRVGRASGIELSGLAGLYCYFLGLAHEWLADGGLAGWLIPSEFMDVFYGMAIKDYLIEKVTLVRIHRFDQNDVQFSDAMVSSAIIWYRKQLPPTGHRIAFTSGGTLERPLVKRTIAADVLHRAAKWRRRPNGAERAEIDAARLSRFFAIKRGQVTGGNAFFILTKEEIARRGLPPSLMRPLLPSPRHLSDDEVTTDKDGHPILDQRLFLLDCRLPEEIVREQHPKLWRYLEEGKAQGVAARYLCRSRNPWYAQERRLPTKFLCTYIGRMSKRRGTPFRFILNHSQAAVANVYLLMYPHGALARLLSEKPALVRRVWRALRDIPTDVLLSEGRVYGGGLYKIEPRELGNVPAAALTELLRLEVPDFTRATDATPTRRQTDLFGAGDQHLATTWQ